MTKIYILEVLDNFWVKEDHLYIKLATTSKKKLMAAALQHQQLHCDGVTIMSIWENDINILTEHIPYAKGT